MAQQYVSFPSLNLKHQKYRTFSEISISIFGHRAQKNQAYKKKNAPNWPLCLIFPYMLNAIFAVALNFQKKSPHYAYQTECLSLRKFCTSDWDLGTRCCSMFSFQGHRLSIISTNSTSAHEFNKKMT